MGTCHKKPVNLDLTTIRMPITAYASILHRISGLVVFLLIPLLLTVFKMSVTSMESLEELKAFFASPLMQVLFWALISGLLYHLIAGVRHLLMDMHIGDGKCSGKLGAWVVMVLGIASAAIVAFWIWG